MKYSDQNQRQGFTTIELLAATALAAVLMTAVLGSMSTLSVKSKELLTRHVSEGWQQRLNEQIHRDLSNARSIRLDDGKLTLVGYGAFGSPSMQITHRAAEVVYVVQQQFESAWLVRYQDSNGQEPGESWRGDVICTQVSGVRVQIAKDEFLTADGEAIAVPNRIRIVIDSFDPSRPVLDRTFHVR